MAVVDILYLKYIPKLTGNMSETQAGSAVYIYMQMLQIESVKSSVVYKS